MLAFFLSYDKILINRHTNGVSMRFFKENSYDVVRLYVNQFGITIFSLILYFSASIVADEAWRLTIYLLISVFSTLFFYALIYYTAWEFGGKDRIRIDAGRMEYNKFKGLYLGLLAGVPNLILSVFSILGKSLYMITGAGFFDLLFAIPNVLLRFTSAMYMGALKYLFNPLDASVADLMFLWQSIGFLVLTVLGALVVHFGYYMGHGCYHIMDFFRAKGAASEKETNKK